MRLRVHPALADLGSAVGSPEQSAVVGRLSGRAIEDPPDQHGNADGGHGLLDALARNRVTDRIDGSRVLRPHHQRERLPLLGGEAVGERRGRLHMVAGDRPVMASQIPAITGHAALDGGHHGRRGRRHPVGPSRPCENGRANPRQHPGGRCATPRGAAQEDAAGVGKREASGRDEEPGAGDPGVGKKRLPRGVDGGEPEPPPRHTSQRPAAAQRLDTDPHRPGPHRPGRERRHRAHPDAGHGDTHCQGTGKAQPGRPSDRVLQPPQQHEHEGQSEAQPGQGRVPQRCAGHAGPQQRHRDRCEPACAHRLEAQRGHQSTSGGTDRVDKAAVPADRAAPAEHAAEAASVSWRHGAARGAGNNGPAARCGRVGGHGTLRTELEPTRAATRRDEPIGLRCSIVDSRVGCGGVEVG